MTEGERVRIPPGAVLFSFLVYAIRDLSLIRFLVSDQHYFPTKLCLALQLEEKQTLFARIEQKKKLTRKLLPFCTFERESGKRAGAWLLEEMGS